MTYSQDSLFRRSCCESCRHDLRWFELVPVISYLVQRGRCNHCHASIPFFIVLTELLFATLFLVFISTGQAVALSAAFISFLIPLAIYDIHHFKVPDHMLLLLGCLLLFIQFNLLFDFSHMFRAVLMIILLHLFYLLTRSIGYGDIKLFSLFALFLPTPYFLLIFMLTYFIGGIAVIFFLSYKTDLKKVPLIPFITVSTLLVLKFYDEFYTIYFGGFI
ncbi:prepilin peptidase [Macrococcus carouselicus]|uniref:prepilin peptidase n=1 Tax=Macrococcus carouselicus TaxID=69969 RepID=UPI003C7C324E